MDLWMFQYYNNVCRFCNFDYVTHIFVVETK